MLVIHLSKMFAEDYLHELITRSGLRMFIVCFTFIFLPRDAAQSAILLRQVVCPSVGPSVHDVEVVIT